MSKILIMSFERPHCYPLVRENEFINDEFIIVSVPSQGNIVYPYSEYIVWTDNSKGE